MLALGVVCVLAGQRPALAQGCHGPARPAVESSLLDQWGTEQAAQVDLAALAPTCPREQPLGTTTHGFGLSDLTLANHAFGTGPRTCRPSPSPPPPLLASHFPDSLERPPRAT